MEKEANWMALLLTIVTRKTVREAQTDFGLIANEERRIKRLKYAKGGAGCEKEVIKRN